MTMTSYQDIPRGKKLNRTPIIPGIIKRDQMVVLLREIGKGIRTVHVPKGETNIITGSDQK